MVWHVSVWAWPVRMRFENEDESSYTARWFLGVCSWSCLSPKEATCRMLLSDLATWSDSLLSRYPMSSSAEVACLLVADWCCVLECNKLRENQLISLIGSIYWEIYHNKGKVSNFKSSTWRSPELTLYSFQICFELQGVYKLLNPGCFRPCRNILRTRRLQNVYMEYF